MTVPKDYLIDPIAHMSGMKGCCGAGVVFRLRASSYYTEASIFRFRERYHNSNLPAPLPRLGNKLHHNTKTLARTTAQLAGTTSLGDNIYKGGSPNRRELALPLWVGFASILSGMNDWHHALWLMTDNVSGIGDVHMGLLNTRDFTKWIIAEQLGTITTSGPVKSLRTSQKIQGWFFIPAWPPCMEMVTQANEYIKNLYKELPTDEHRQQKQNCYHKRAKANEEAYDAIASGW